MQPPAIAPPPALTRDIALFLDFDGVLVEIVPTPDAVVVPEDLPEALMAVHAFLDGAVAVVSGRALADVTRRLQPAVLPGSGSHGLERRCGDGTVLPPDPAIGETARHIREALEKRLGGYEGLLIEKKEWSVALHYRQAPDLRAVCEESMAEVISKYTGWEAINGKMLVEARLAGISKADAVDQFMAEPPFAGRLPVFVGDDLTDEDGMRAAQALGGYGIKVGPGESVGRYRLADPSAVLAYLQSLQS